MVFRSQVSARGALFSGRRVARKHRLDRNPELFLKTWRRGPKRAGRLLSWAVAVMLIGAFCAPSQGQTLAPSWYQQTPQTSPPARYITALTYDAAHGQAVLFGGFGSTYLNDTWLWNGTTWTQANPVTSPPARAAHAMVYDPVHGQVVLFGGLTSSGTRLADTWLWNGTNWTQASPATVPPGRDAAVMVYDAATSQVLMFGGVNNAGFDINDTWVWNGTNWTQLSPTNSPPIRDDFSMVYDAAIGQVVLFGGSSNGSYLNDTWTWDGTNWTQQAPANSPPARYAQGTAYHAALGQVVMFGGYNGAFLNDTWLYDGTNWTQDATANSPTGRYTPNGITYDVAQAQVLLFGGLNTNQFSDTWEWGLPGNFGNINVCHGQSTPAPCSGSLSLTYNIAAPTALGTPQVVTEGTSGLDFNLGSGSTCTGTVSAGTCTVNITFAPVFPGLRSGAVELFNSSGTQLTSTLISGVGQGPAFAFLPSGGGVLGTGDYSLTNPEGVAVDAAANVYIADTGAGRVVRIAPGGGLTYVGTGISSPEALAIDGADDLFITDFTSNQVVEVPAGCTGSSCQQVIAPNLRDQDGVAVDPTGDVFISDGTDHEVVEVPAGCTSSGCQIVVYNPSSGTPGGLALDAAGDLFIADSALRQIVEVPAGCTTSACQVTVGQGWSAPFGVAVDAAGDVFGADPGLSAVVEVPVGCTSAGCQITVLSNGIYPYAVTVDEAGNVYAPDINTSQVYVLNRDQIPSLTFASTNVGSTSSDSPQSVILQNIGNQPLSAVSSGLTVTGPNFAQVAGSGTPADCTGSFSLNPGQECNVSIIFAPTTAGNPLTSTAVFTDNAASATQSVALSGVGVANNYSLTVTGIGSGSGAVYDSYEALDCTVTNGVTSGSCAAGYSNGSVVTLYAYASQGSVFLGWGGVCASAGTSSSCTVTVSQAESVTVNFANQSFGTVNVCPAGQNTPAPCTATSPITFTLAATTTIGAIEVVTQGSTGLDFTPGTGTCSGTITAGNACTVNVTFTPLAAGLRLGAIELFDKNANLVATTPIYGIGQEAEIAFSPAPQTTVNTTANYPLAQPRGITVDAAGNTLIADSGNNRVVKVTPGGTAGTIGSGLSTPQNLAVDGAGDVFIADSGLNQVVEIPAGCTTAACQTAVGSGLSDQHGVAVDQFGDVFIASTAQQEVVEVPPGCTSSECQSVVYGPESNLNPVGVAVDAAGDVFVADIGIARVMEVPAGCFSSDCQLPVGSGFSQPAAVAVDAAGDLFVSDESKDTVVEIPFGCANSTCQITVVSGISSAALAVDGAGNVFVPGVTNNQVVKLNRPQAPSFPFAQLNAGSTSSASPLVVQNVGNEPLTGSLALSLGGSFTQTVGADCASALPLAPGAICSESFSFKPQSATFFSGTALFSDNALNTTPARSQTVTLSGVGATAGVAGTVAVPNLVGLAQTAVTSPIASAGLVAGTLTTASSSTVAAGNVIGQNPSAGTQVAVGSAVNLLVSSGIAQPTPPNPLSLNDNYFVTGDYVAAGVTLRGKGKSGTATGSIVIPAYAQSTSGGVPLGADIIDAFLYWETLENTPKASSTNGTFNNYPIVGQQIGDDQPNYKDGAFTGTIRAYRADVNIYLPVGANGIRFAAGSYTVGLPDSGGTALPLTEGASLVIIYRVLSPNFPLKSVVIYDGAALSTSSQTQPVQGFYDAVGGGAGTGKATNLFASGSTWNTSVNTSATLGKASQYTAPLTAGNAYAAVILSTPVNNSDNDGILDAWKTGPSASDFHAGQPGYYDAKTATWVGLPGAKHGQKDLFVQLDYMCGGVLASGACDPTKENLFPSPDANGNDPLAMTQAAFAASGVQLHLTIGNIVPESTCTDDLTTKPPQLCQFPNQPGVVGWKNSVEFSKLYPRNLAACLSGGDCTTRFPYGQKDSYHYVLFGHSLAIPAWNTRYGTLTSITVTNGVTTIVTADRGTGINACPSRITLEGVLGDPALNGVYNTTSCADTKTITVATPGVPNYTFPNRSLPEPAIGLTSGTITSISGYSDLGGSDSAVTLGLWLTAPNQDMSKRANVLAGTLFHEIGHTLGLSHGGLYYDTPSSYVPTFDANCKPNFQSVMNYLFQLDLVGPNQSLAFSNQSLKSVNENAAGSITTLTDASGNAATFPTSAWYVPYTTGSTASPATLHCDGTPLEGEQGYRVDSSIAPITPAWTNGQDLSFIGTLQSNERGYNDLANLDLRQVGATGGEFASLATLLSFGSSVAPLNVGSGGNVTLGSGGTVALGSGGNVTLGSGGNVTLGSGGSITLGSGGNVTLGSGGNVTLGSGGTITPGSGGTVTLGSGGNVTLGSGGTITLGSGGNVTLGSGGNVTLGSGGTITLGSGGTVTVPPSGGSYSIDSSGGTITLGSGGNVTLGSGGNVTLGSGGTITLGSGGNVTLGSGGNVTLGSGGTVTLGSGGNVTLGSGGNVTLGSGGTITLGSGGNVTLGSGGNVTLGSGGTVTLGSGGNVTLGSGGNVTLGSGGEATLGAGGTVTLGSGGNVTLGSGGTVTLGSGGTVTLGSGGTPISVGAGGTVTLGSGGTVTLGSGGTITLGSGGNVTLGSGGVVTLGKGGSVNLGSGTDPSLATVNNVTSGGGGPSTTELTYETANSIVRPPGSPSETKTTAGVLVTWKAPAFGVVETYTIYRSSNGATPIIIGSVSGVNGNAPATEFLDINPDLTSKTVVYTITTTLVADSFGPPRRSAPSAPAVLKNNQSITLAPLPSSVLITSPPTVSATAMSNGAANGLEVMFTATGSCSIASESITNKVSSAKVALATTGSCTITASQPGTTAYNPANSVSGTFTVLPKGSGTKSQAITFASLANVQYGSSFSLSASSSSGLKISFAASGPCTTAGKTTGAGVCRITASAPASTTYSAGSLTQSFTIDPAVLEVTANNLVTTYGQPLPSLTYTYKGFVNGDTSSAVSGAPALSTAATSTSNVGSYPITVSTGTLAASNYSFLYVNGTLTVQTKTVPTPVLTAATGTFTTTNTITITDSLAGTTIYYTMNGTTPNTSSTKYTGPITISSDETIKAIAYKSGYTQSNVATATYTITKTVPLPTFTPAAGTYTKAQSVTIKDLTIGATLYYTTNGTTPTTSSTKYTGPITVSSSETIKAIGTASGYASSAVATAKYTINK
jgi:hypothetical protein